MKSSLTVSEAHQGLRLDIFLTQVLEDVPSRSFVQKLIETGHVTVRGKTAVAKYKVMSGDQVFVDAEALVLPPQDIEPQNIPLDIFYEDEDIVIINKPVGISVHPASEGKNGTLANALVHHFQGLSDVSPGRPGIVHRLDKETSGLLVVAKHNTAHARLGRQFEKHSVMKRYVALVEGVVQFDEGVIEVPLGRHARYHDLRQVAEEGEGKEAVTLYQVLKRHKKSTLLALYPQTGRTHQLRVHLKHLGHPILGDDKYGRRDSFPRLALHAQSLGFQHPASKQYVEFSCRVPLEFFQENPK